MSHSIADHHPRAFVTGASAGLGQAFAKMLKCRAEFAPCLKKWLKTLERRELFFM